MHGSFLVIRETSPDDSNRTRCLQSLRYDFILTMVSVRDVSSDVAIYWSYRIVTTGTAAMP